MSSNQDYLAKLLKEAARHINSENPNLAFELIQAACELKPGSVKLRKLRDTRLENLLETASKNRGVGLIAETHNVFGLPEPLLNTHAELEKQGRDHKLWHPPYVKSKLRWGENFERNLAYLAENMFVKRTEQEIMKNWQPSSDLISIVCISYNHEQTIEEAILSFLAQETSVPFEIVVQDDFSQDGTRRIINSYIERYPNIIRASFPSENLFSKGASPLRKGVESSRGNFIAFCEGDDYFNFTNKLQVQYDALQRSPSVFACFHRCARMEEPLKRSRHLFEELNSCPHAETILEGDRVIMRQFEVPRVNSLFQRRPDDISKQFPEELSHVVLGDAFNASVIGLFGDILLLEGFLAATYRLDGEGIWTGMIEDPKKIHRFSQKVWLGQYFERLGLKEASEKYLREAQRELPNIDLSLYDEQNPFFAKAHEAAAILKNR